MILLAAFLVTVKSNKRLSNQLFAAFLIITAFDLAGLFLGKNISSLFAIKILRSSSSLLQMPFFYLYVLSVCFSDFTIKIKHFLHIILFLLFALIFTLTSFSPLSFQIYTIAIEVQYITYIFAIFWILKKYKTVYLENYSNPNYTYYKWLFQVTVVFCIAHIFVLIKLYISYFQKEQVLFQSINILISLSALFVTCWFVLKALYNPQIFSGIKMELKPLESQNESKPSNAKESVRSKDSIKKLSLYMEREKPYLDFDLTLQKLSFQICIPEKKLSSLINHDLGQHFFDFINEYRINEAKSILENPTKHDLTVLEILYEVGFNSKSSFYTAFKKMTNQTPIQYRKKFMVK